MALVLMMVKTHNASLEQGLVGHDETLGFVKVAEAHDLGIASIAIHPTHHTLVITEEEDGETGDAVDENQQRPPLVAISYVPLGNTIHGG